MDTFLCCLGLVILYVEGTSSDQSWMCRENHLTARDEPGALASPGYPVAYRNNLDCTLTIEVENSSAVVYIHVLNSTLEFGQSRCNSYRDRVIAYDGQSVFNAILMQWCGRQTPSIRSTGRYLTLHFRTDFSIEDRGFNLTYQQQRKQSDEEKCGRTSLTADNFIKRLTSPGFPYRYRNYLDCRWVISANYDFNIKLVVTNVQLEKNGYRCSEAYVTVYDGNTTSASVIGTFCESMPTFISTGNYMMVRFKTNWNIAGKGFELTYQSGHFIASCGAQLSATSYSKTITSPGYPDQYRNNLNCTWSITTSYSNIKIIVTSSQMEPGCRNDRVQVYDGLSSHILGTFCVSETPTYISSTSLVRINFVTDNSIVSKGFQLQYRGGNFTENCGRDLQALSYSQDFTSPGYPANYRPNLNCTWTFTTTYKDMKLVVSDSELQPSSTCAMDYVKVYDGWYNHALGHFCGSDTPTYISTTQRVRLNFITDNSVQSKGFRISYSGGDFTDTTTCGSVFLTASVYVRYLKSPDYPNDYRNNLDCEWTITANSGFIKLSVLDADMEKSVSDCQNDYVQIYSGSSSSGELLGKFCGTQRPTLVSPSNIITVSLTTDNSGVGKGFRLSYQSGRFSVCDNEELTSYMSTNQISSPFYPVQYPNNADCTWTINTYDSDFAVYIEIPYLDIEGDGSHCYSDYLQAVDDRYDYGTSLGTWCGSNIPSSQHSSGQYMFIKFHSDGNTRKTGFELQYSSKEISSFRKLSVSGAVSGGIAAGVVVIVSIGCFASYRMRKSRRTPEQRSAVNNQARRATAPPIPQQMVYVVGSGSPTATMVPTSFPTPSAPATFAPPPSYNEVLANDQENQTEVPPPPYSSLGIMSEAPKAVTGDAGSITRSDTHPIISRETVPHTYQGQDNRAGPTA